MKLIFLYLLLFGLEKKLHVFAKCSMARPCLKISLDCFEKGLFWIITNPQMISAQLRPPQTKENCCRNIAQHVSATTVPRLSAQETFIVETKC